jgi:hypothetical protein
MYYIDNRIGSKERYIIRDLISTIKKMFWSGKK